MEDPFPNATIDWTNTSSRASAAPASLWLDSGYPGTTSWPPLPPLLGDPLGDPLGGAAAAPGDAAGPAAAGPATTNVLETGLIVPLYVVIFILSVVGNSLVLVTLAQRKRMRTVTNVYLLNLAVSDLLLGVFCMPFTLLGQLLKNFVFGAAMCKLIPYFQAVSVSVGVWTLVAISLERYFAICRPLKSRRWQTQFHAYKMIAVVWVASCLWNAPILVVSRLKAMQNTGRHKCREEWSSLGSERTYNLFLDAMLLLVPLVIMSLAYLLIVSKLWRGLRREIRHSSSCKQPVSMALAGPSPVSGEAMVHMLPLHPHANGGAAARVWGATPARSGRGAAARNAAPKRRTDAFKMWLRKARRTGGAAGGSVAGGRTLRPATNGSTLADPHLHLHQQHLHLHALEPESPLIHSGQEQDAQDGEPLSTAVGVPVCPLARHAIRSNYMDKSIEAKKKVIRMLFVVVAEFFVCWAPLHVLNTWYLFNPEQVYAWVGSTGVSLVQLMAYVSSCCNPITYCFMNRKFRQAFLGVFNCHSGCCPATPCCRGGPRRPSPARSCRSTRTSRPTTPPSTPAGAPRPAPVGLSWSRGETAPRWWSWKTRLVFSSDRGGSGRSSLGGLVGLGHAGGSQGLSPAVVEAPVDSDDEVGFRLRISWKPRPSRRPTSSGTSAPTCSTSSSELYA